LSGASVLSGAAEHPVCGDRLELDCRVELGNVTEFAWRAEGCPATMAVAAAARRAVRGRPVAAAMAALERRVADLGGLARTEQHAIALFRRAWAEVVGQVGAK
jgi:NifU-like protein involved in Fe-S cluster formation